MHLKTTFSKVDASKRIEILHCESQQLKSHLQFMLDEITFIDHLLNSYLFEPNTPNLFERLQNFTAQIHKQIRKREQLVLLIEQHENDLGAMLQYAENSCGTVYCVKHEKLRAEVIACLEGFRDLKTEVFLYAGEILKKRKP